jgi:hypothetical protein
VTDRRIEYMPLPDVLGAPRNPKRHDQQGIAASVSRFGFVEVPTIDERTGRLVAGHGRLQDLTDRHAAGQTPPDGVHVDADGVWLIPVNRGWGSRSDAEADAYLAASNKLTENGGWHQADLDAMLADVAAVDLDLAVATGFSVDYLSDLLDTPDTAGALTDPVIEHAEVPATGAAYAETPEQEQARADRQSTWEPKFAPGSTEMVLVYSADDKEELQRHITACREVLGKDLRASEIILRAAQTLTAVLDARHSPDPVMMSVFAKGAGADDINAQGGPA